MEADVLLVITPVEKLTTPATVRLPPVKFKVLPVPLNVKLAQFPVSPDDNIGILGADVGITTAVDEVGTPPHQLVPSFQSVLVVPNHEPAANIVAEVVTGTEEQPPDEGIV
jgi:hypothetical protein